MKECPNCNRTEDTVPMTDHHLTPKEKGGNSNKDNMLMMCKDCHAQVHLLYDNKYLRNNLYTSELLLADEKLIKFGKFASKQKKRITKKQSKNKKYKTY